MISMKIAVPWEANNVFQHFGQTTIFAIYEAEGNKACEKGLMDVSESGGHCALVDLLKEGSIDVVICGGIGQGARDKLQAAGITLVAGVSGRIADVVFAYLNGSLEAGSGICEGHSQGHTCH